MADPRLSVDFVGIGAVYAAFKADGSTIDYDADEDDGSDQVGLAVTMESDGTIETVGDGEPVVGKLIKVEADNVCTVQIAGGMELAGGDGASLTVGKKIVGDLDVSTNEGYIREVATATAAELGLQRGFIVDASTTTAVLVFL